MPDSEKMTRAPVLRRNRRRAGWCFNIEVLPLRTGGCDGAQHGEVASTATQIVGQRSAHLRLSRARVAGEQGDRLHDHAVGAVAALSGLLLNERLLDGMQLSIDDESLERRNRLGHR